jgi:hypothetical protein
LAERIGEEALSIDDSVAWIAELALSINSLSTLVGLIFNTFALGHHISRIAVSADARVPIEVFAVIRDLLTLLLSKKPPV